MNVLEGYLADCEKLPDDYVFYHGWKGQGRITFGDLRAFAAEHKALVEQNLKTCKGLLELEQRINALEDFYHARTPND